MYSIYMLCNINEVNVFYVNRYFLWTLYVRLYDYVWVCECAYVTRIRNCYHCLLETLDSDTSWQQLKSILPRIIPPGYTWGGTKRKRLFYLSLCQFYHHDNSLIIDQQYSTDRIGTRAFLSFHMLNPLKLNFLLATVPM